MKIETALVIDKKVFDNVINDLNKQIVNSNDRQIREFLNTVLKMVNSFKDVSKPLTPIIQDAWNCNDSTLSDYLNEKEI